MNLRILPFAALALALAAPAAAQPFRSDVTGPVVTGSGVAGVGYHGAAFRDVQNALFRTRDGRVVFRTRAVADAVSSRAAVLLAEVCASRLEAPDAWNHRMVLPDTAQRIVCGLLRTPGLDSPEARATLAALAGPDGVAGEDAVRLVAALAGLFLTPAEAVDKDGRWIAGERWEQAFRAYEAFLDGAPDAVLDPPPAVLATVGAILADLVEAGARAGRR